MLSEDIRRVGEMEELDGAAYWHQYLYELADKVEKYENWIIGEGQEPDSILNR